MFELVTRLFIRIGIRREGNNFDSSSMKRKSDDCDALDPAIIFLQHLDDQCVSVG